MSVKMKCFLQPYGKLHCPEATKGYLFNFEIIRRLAYLQGNHAHIIINTIYFFEQIIINAIEFHFVDLDNIWVEYKH